MLHDENVVSSLEFLVLHVAMAAVAAVGDVFCTSLEFFVLHVAMAAVAATDEGLAACLEFLVLHVAVAAVAAMDEGIASSLGLLVLDVDPTCMLQIRNLDETVDWQAHLGRRRRNCDAEPVELSNTASAW